MLSVSIKKRLDNFTLEVEFETDGETMALLGASGCGKSMTLKCIAGIEKPDSGRIVLDGRVLFDSEKRINLPPQQRKVGYLFQNYALFPNMTVCQNIAAGCRERDKGKKQALVDEMLRAMRLEDAAQQYPGEISGGQQQRTALARILINRPDILLLDEPFTALDNYLKWQLEADLADTISNYGGTSLMVSHNMDEVYRLCSCVCVLHKGKAQPKQTVRQLFECPSTAAAAELAGFRNFSRVEKQNDGSFLAADWGITLPCRANLPTGNFTAGIRGRHINLSAVPSEGSFPCTVYRVTEDISSILLLLNTPAGGIIHAETNREHWLTLNSAGKVWANISPENIIFFDI